MGVEVPTPATTCLFPTLGLPRLKINKPASHIGSEPQLFRANGEILAPSGGTGVDCVLHLTEIQVGTFTRVVRSMQGRVFLGRYRTERLLGEGGMGRVYLAQQLDLGRTVVVKVMHDHIAADPKFCDRFTRETLVMAKFQHPYAVTLYDASLDDPEGPCIVMEYIQGITLDSLLRRDGQLPPVRVSRLLRQLTEVLQAAHAKGIIHRDLKPANLMVVDAGTPYEMLKVMDFGLAKLLAFDPRNPNGVTTHEFAVGTPGYMCPEQARGDEMDHRGDLYSVGVILYEMLAGRQPFAGGSTMELLLAHATEAPPSFARIGASGLVTPALEQLVHCCLSKNAADRPSTARELSERFDSALTAAAEPSPPRTPRMSMNGTLPGRSPSRLLPGATTASVLPAPAAAPPTPPAPPVPATALPTSDPATMAFHLEAWMPERIAAYKLRGFIQDANGEVLENIPGRIRVRLGGKGCLYALPDRGLLASIGLGRRSCPIDMELRLQRTEGGRDNQLRITVLLRPQNGDLSQDAAWRELCNRIFCDLRGYLMGAGATSRGVV
jgi:eukaryotic-like serine/threonine-protein kinase